MPSSSGPSPFDRTSLSALHDGEATDADLAACLARWDEDAHLRACWHRYALIGDVLRSADLAQGARHDDAFLARLSARLADEPAPVSTSARADEQAGAAADAVGTGRPAAHERVPTGTPLAKAIDPIGPAPAGAANDRIVVPLAPARRARQAWRRWSVPVGIAAGLALVGSVVLIERQGPRADDALAQAQPQDNEVRQVLRDPRRASNLDPYLAAHRQFQPLTVYGGSALRNANFDLGSDR